MPGPPAAAEGSRIGCPVPEFMIGLLHTCRHPMEGFLSCSGQEFQDAPLLPAGFQRGGSHRMSVVGMEDQGLLRSFIQCSDLDQS
jgi:hypothetical protein